ncbi:protein SENESCENCE-ASSOCIATED GENE 21, mitochondrial [Zea mays]|uniref:protein SENESCENCE-ASSOCIATED GENE 21, mitochondrial n=1 Tax=Zea mays TaxID=4577 RepID=UPI0004DEAF9A|nr:protein SENESCENCE-ASSOCIATED GENE 21, mitochondrial [Zea mays]|eukprot:XP_008655822.1 protein SENESCENCE-ASSOCIATED GENE 21, mitochondrial [Zea mays]
MERVASSCTSILTQRRPYSVAAAMAKEAARRADGNKAAAAAAVTKRVMGKKEVNTAAAAAEQKKAWLPNPVTGYYRPAGSPREVDAAELCAKLLTG